LSVHLARVKKGQTLSVTEHGHVVAELRPVRASDDGLARLIAEGRVTPGTKPVSALPRPLSLQLDRPVSALLDEMREDLV
jgi:antitoxin (DNA-binding transcriptional repressor) of toxin-antitoxin stability system